MKIVESGLENIEETYYTVRQQISVFSKGDQALMVSARVANKDMPEIYVDIRITHDDLEWFDKLAKEVAKLQPKKSSSATRD